MNGVESKKKRKIENLRKNSTSIKQMNNKRIHYVGEKYNLTTKNIQWFTNRILHKKNLIQWHVLKNYQVLNLKNCSHEKNKNKVSRKKRNNKIILLSKCLKI
jgi:hypothetical protein